MDTTPERDRAAKIRDDYTEKSQALYRNADLTDEARRRQLAEAWRATSTELDKLKVAEQTRLAVRERELERRLFGAGDLAGPDFAISTRDAQDRASRLRDPEEAADMLERAERNGDQALAKAVAHQALQKSRTAMGREASNAWDDVAARFIEARPAMASVVEELASIERLTARRVFSPFSVPQPIGVQPQDINRASDLHAASMAVSNDIRAAR